MSTRNSDNSSKVHEGSQVWFQQTTMCTKNETRVILDILYSVVSLL